MKRQHPEFKLEYQDVFSRCKRHYYAYELLPQKNINGWILTRTERHLFARFEQQFDRDDWVKMKPEFRKAVYCTYPPLKNINSRLRAYSTRLGRMTWRRNEEGVEVFY